MDDDRPEPVVKIEPDYTPSHKSSLPPRQPLKVGGRLHHYWQTWQQKGASPYIVSLLKDGLKLDFKEQPPLTKTPIVMESYAGDPVREAALRAALEELLEKDVLEEVKDTNSPGFYGRLFIRPKPNGKWRSIIDLSELNTYVNNPTFHMESAISIQNQMRPGMVATSIDLTDAYYHVPVNYHYRKYMRIALFGKVLQFKAMPMGLNVSARIFTKLIMEVMRMVRAKGIHIHAYLDDWLLKAWAKDRRTLRAQTRFVVQLAEELGLLVNLEKSELEPKDRTKYVGVRYHLDLGLALPPLETLAEIENLIRKLLRRRGGSAREWSSLIGKLGSVMRQVQLGPLHRRPVQKILMSQWDQKTQDWEEWVSMLPEYTEAMKWWLDRKNTTRGVSLSPYCPDQVLYTDASKQGYGATLGSIHIKESWNAQERLLHSNNLEMLAVIKAVDRLAPKIRGSSLLINTDNTTVVATINRQGGTKAWNLTEMAWTLWLKLDKLNCQVRAKHIPGRLNVTADALSRMSQVVATEWSLHQSAVELIWQKWGTPQVDLFATQLNSKLQRFVAPFPDQQAWAVDAMSISWDRMFCYAFPPWNMMGEVLMKVREDQAEMIIVAPAWPGRPWFPLLLDLLVDQPLKLPDAENLLYQAHSGRLHNNVKLLNLHAFRLSGKQSEARDIVTEWLS